MRLAWCLVLASCGRLDFDVGVGDAGPDADPSGLVAWYPMDDDPSTGTVTAIPAAFTAQCTACPTKTAGKIGGGYAFDGTMRIPLPSTTLVGLQPFTVALWMNATPNPQLYSMVSKPHDLATNLDVLSLTLDAQTAVVAFESNTAGLVTSVASSVTVMMSTWQHVAATWDGTTQRIYLNGVETGANAGSFDDSMQALAIGSDLDGGAPNIWFIGSLDDVRFYNRALPATDILALANP